MSQVLVVEDDVRLRQTLAMNLSARGFDVLEAGTGADALEAFARCEPDVVLLDLGLPDADGTEVVRKLRVTSSVPVIVVSARNEEAAKVAALDLGADDYLTKPFGMDELLARVRAALRRVSMPDDVTVVRTDAFVIDFARKEVTRDAHRVRLTPTEWAIVEVLVRNAGRVVAHQDLLREVWGPKYTGEATYLRVYLTQIRRKLEPEPSAPRYFLTEPRVGFRFENAHG